MWGSVAGPSGLPRPRTEAPLSLSLSMWEGGSDKVDGGSEWWAGLCPEVGK